MTVWVHRLLPLLIAVSALAAASCSRVADPSPGTPSQAHQPAYAAVARGRVDVEGGQLPLSMPMEATLTEVGVHEGDRVTSGQVLAVADATAARAQLDTAQARLAQARQRQHGLQTRIQLADRRAQRLAQAAMAGAGDGQSADDARDTAIQLSAELEAARSAAAIANAELDQARYLLGRHTLRAPMNAEVLHVAAQAGMSVSPQSPALFLLLPLTTHIVRAELNETFVAAVRVGMPAQIVTDDNQQTIAGSARVTRIGSVFGRSTMEDEAGARVGERSVECILTLTGASPLRVGQRVLVRFLAKPAAPAAQ